MNHFGIEYQRETRDDHSIPVTFKYTLQADEWRPRHAVINGSDARADEKSKISCPP
jgi:hypothetical protein